MWHTNFVLHSLLFHKEDTIMQHKGRRYFVISPVGVGAFSRVLLRFRHSSIGPVWQNLVLKSATVIYM